MHSRVLVYLNKLEHNLQWMDRLWIKC